MEGENFCLRSSPTLWPRGAAWLSSTHRRIPGVASDWAAFRGAWFAGWLGADAERRAMLEARMNFRGPALVVGLAAEIGRAHSSQGLIVKRAAGATRHPAAASAQDTGEIFNAAAFSTPSKHDKERRAVVWWEPTWLPWGVAKHLPEARKFVRVTSSTV
jgi:hypothetical protein